MSHIMCSLTVHIPLGMPSWQVAVTLLAFPISVGKLDTEVSIADKSPREYAEQEVQGVNGILRFGATVAKPELIATLSLKATKLVLIHHAEFGQIVCVIKPDAAAKTAMVGFRHHPRRMERILTGVEWFTTATDFSVIQLGRGRSLYDWLTTDAINGVREDHSVSYLQYVQHVTDEGMLEAIGWEDATAIEL